MKTLLKIPLKIILIPVVIVLWVITLAGKVATNIASWLLYLVSGLFALIGIVCLIFGEVTFMEALPMFGASFFITLVCATSELIVDGIGGICGLICDFIKS